MTDTQTEVKAHKAEGSLATIKVKDLQNNPHRDNEVFVWNEDKIKGLTETYLMDGFQSTFEVTPNKIGKIFLAGGGHHRTEALRRAIDSGLADQIRGLFKDSDDDWCIKVVKKNYTPQEMMRNFIIENADAWGKDAQQNICMMVVQVQSALTRKLMKSKDVDDFIESLNCVNEIKMDDRAFTRAKNAGTVGASLISQYLGENTWSREAIDKAVNILSSKGAEGKKMREIAEKMPSIVTAYKFKQLMTEMSDEGDKVLSSVKDQAKAEKLIDSNKLTRKDIEAANKIKKERGVSGLEALESFIVETKDALKSDKPAAKEKASEPAMQPPEKALDSLKATLNYLTVLDRTEDAKFSKAQFNQAKKILQEIAEVLKKQG